MIGNQRICMSQLKMFQVYKLQGITLHHTNQDKQAINALLTALDLDPESADDITDHIAAVVGHMCGCPFDLAETLHSKLEQFNYQMTFDLSF